MVYNFASKAMTYAKQATTKLFKNGGDGQKEQDDDLTGTQNGSKMDGENSTKASGSS